jgi:TetR/AcrR family transcriptional regulator, transcriptional repressor for nem operon
MARTGRPRSFIEDQVVHGAKELFWRRGYAATSLRELKDDLGVLPGSLYVAFGDKHALFLRALMSYADDMREAAASIRGGGPVLPCVRALLSGVLAAARDAPGRGCMLGNTATELLPDDKASAEVVCAAFRSLEQAIEEALVAAQCTGEVRADVDCGAQARLLVALMQGLHVVARAEPDPRRLDDVVDAALAALTPAPALTTKRTRAAR